MALLVFPTSFLIKIHFRLPQVGKTMIRVSINEPFGLGCFTTGDSHRSRFATFVRSCSALPASKYSLKISSSKLGSLITPFGRGKLFNPTILKFTFYDLYATNIHMSVYMRLLKTSYSGSAYLLTYDNFWVFSLSKL